LNTQFNICIISQQKQLIEGNYKERLEL
jgi:hypothetical protein